MFSPALALMTKGLDPTRRGVISSQLSTADTLGSGIGMLVGAIAIDNVSWRWIFLGPAPFLSILCISSFFISADCTNAAKGRVARSFPIPQRSHHDAPRSECFAKKQIEASASGKVLDHCVQWEVVKLESERSSSGASLSGKSESRSRRT